MSILFKHFTQITYPRLANHVVILFTVKSNNLSYKTFVRHSTNKSGTITEFVFFRSYQTRYTNNRLWHTSL